MLRGCVVSGTNGQPIYPSAGAGPTHVDHGVRPDGPAGPTRTAFFPLLMTKIKIFHGRATCTAPVRAPPPVFFLCVYVLSTCYPHRPVCIETCASGERVQNTLGESATARISKHIWTVRDSVCCVRMCCDTYSHHHGLPGNGNGMVSVAFGIGACILVHSTVRVAALASTRPLPSCCAVVCCVLYCC
jgi:hypothetical protein